MSAGIIRSISFHGWWPDYPVVGNVGTGVTYAGGTMTGTADLNVALTATEHLKAEQILRARLLASTDISGPVGARLSDWASAESDKYPYGTFSRIDSDYIQSMQGGSDYVKVRMQLDWFSNDLSQAGDLGENSRQLLDGYQGTVSVGSTSVEVKIILADERHAPEMPDNASDEPVYRVSQDYIIAHGETAAN